MKRTGEEQYLDLANRILKKGTLIKNKRTGKGCFTVINADFEYDTSKGDFPLVTTRKSYWRQAIAEMLGYLRMGFQYAQGRSWGINDFEHIDQYKNIIDKLSAGIDDRRLIMTFNNPGTKDSSALDACMHTHHFSMLNGMLYLTSYQRSIDVPLGLVFNMVQCVWLLRITAQITGLKPGTVYHKLVNCHIYDDQANLMETVQLIRTPFDPPKLYISDNIKTLNDLETWVDMDSFSIAGYRYHEAIEYPFSV